MLNDYVSPKHGGQTNGYPNLELNDEEMITM